MKHTIGVFLFGTTIAVSSVGVADTLHTLDDAILDYSGTSPTSLSSSYSQTGRYQTTIVLDESYYDWSPRSFQRLEEAEFAAFEVPDDLEVQD